MSSKSVEALKARAARLGLVLYVRADGTFILDHPLEEEPHVTECRNESAVRDHLNGFEHAGSLGNPNTEDVLA
jgi:hypothetical protein